MGKQKLFSVLILAAVFAIGSFSLAYAADKDEWFPIPTTGEPNQAAAGAECDCQYQSGAKGVIRNGDCNVENCWTKIE